MIPPASVIEAGVGDERIAAAWGDWARKQVQRWEPARSPHDLLDELVPWWREVARATDLPVDDPTWTSGLDLRLGRDACGAPRVLETADGRLVATASPGGEQPVAVVASSQGAVSWEVGSCDAEGTLRAWHRIFRIDDHAVAWSAGTARGDFRTVQHDRADGPAIAVWPGPPSSSEPAPSSRRSVDAVVRIDDGSAEVLDGRRPTIGACERRRDELADTRPTDGVDADAPPRAPPRTGFRATRTATCSPDPGWPPWVTPVARPARTWCPRPRP